MVDMDTLIRENQFCKKELDNMLARELEIKNHMHDLRREAINHIRAMVTEFDISFTEMIKIYEINTKSSVCVFRGLEEEEFND